MLKSGNKSKNYHVTRFVLVFTIFVTVLTTPCLAATPLIFSELINPLKKACQILVFYEYWRTKARFEAIEILHQILHPDENHNDIGPGLQITFQWNRINREGILKHSKNCYIFIALPDLSTSMDPNAIADRIRSEEDNQTHFYDRVFLRHPTPALDFYNHFNPIDDFFILLWPEPTDMKTKPPVFQDGQIYLKLSCEIPYNYLIFEFFTGASEEEGRGPNKIIQDEFQTNINFQQIEMKIQQDMSRARVRVWQVKVKCKNMIPQCLQEIPLDKHPNIWNSYMNIKEYLKWTRMNFHKNVFKIFTDYSGSSNKFDLDKIFKMGPHEIYSSRIPSLPEIKMELEWAHYLNLTPLASPPDWSRCEQGEVAPNRWIHAYHPDQHKVVHSFSSYVIYYGINKELDGPSHFYDLIHPLKPSVWLLIFSLFIISCFLYKVMRLGDVFCALGPFFGQVPEFRQRNIKKGNNYSSSSSSSTMKEDEDRSRRRELAKFPYAFWLLLIFFLTSTYEEKLQSFKIVPVIHRTSKSMKDLLREKYVIHRHALYLTKQHLESWFAWMQIEDAILRLDYEMLINNTVPHPNLYDDPKVPRSIFTKDRMAILTSASEAESDLEVLQMIFGRSFYKTKQTFFNLPNSWDIQMFHADYVSKPIDWFINNGIHGFWIWMKQSMAIMNKKRAMKKLFRNEKEQENIQSYEHPDEISPLDFSDNVLKSILILWSVGLAISILGFSSEIIVFKFYEPKPFRHDVFC